MPPPEPGEEVLVVFRPVWRGSQEGLEIMRCLPAAPAKGQLAQNGEAAALAQHTLGMLESAFRALTYAASKRGPFRLMVSISSACLVNGQVAAAIVGLAKKLDPVLRKAVIIELYDFPDNFKLDYLDDATIPLMAFFDNFIAASPLGMKDFTVFTNCNYFAVSLNMGHFGTPMEASSALEKFCAKAEQARLKVFVHGAIKREIVDLAKSLMVAGIDGPCFGCDQQDLFYKPGEIEFNFSN